MPGGTRMHSTYIELATHILAVIVATYSCSRQGKRSKYSINEDTSQGATLFKHPSAYHLNLALTPLVISTSEARTVPHIIPCAHEMSKSL